MIDVSLIVTAPAAGGAGVATAVGLSPIVNGKIRAVHVNDGQMVAVTGRVRMYDEADPVGERIIDNIRNGKFHPRAAPVGVHGDFEYAAGFPVACDYVVSGRLRVELFSADAGDIATVTVWLET
jgi:hypothetical protein